jgi:hypothetical protein
MRKGFLSLLVLTGLMLLVDARAARAGCVMDLWTCYHRAARYDTWWERTFAGIDCELDFTECTRRKIGGW